MIQAPSARGKARSFRFVVAFLAVVGVAAACSLSPRANGESCIKDGDCLSSLCIQTVCVAQPNLLDAEVNGDGGTPDGSTTGDGATPDGSPPNEAAAEAAADTGSVGGDSGAADTGATDSGSADSASE
jgi:hypothetical protein